MKKGNHAVAHDLNKVALITGASRGIGREIALRLAERVGRVAVHYFQHRALACQVAAEIEKLGVESRVFRADLSSPAAGTNLVSRVEKAWGRVDILVNNFGPFLVQPWEKTTAEDWLNLYQTNVVRGLEMIKAVLPGMRQRKWGRIINLGFHRAGQITPFPQVLPYAAAKTALLLLTKTVALTEAQHGITVNMVSPGLIEGGELPFEPGEAATSSFLGKPEDVAAAVSFLASDEARAITGVNLIVAGIWKM